MALLPKNYYKQKFKKDCSHIKSNKILKKKRNINLKHSLLSEGTLKKIILRETKHTVN